MSNVEDAELCEGLSLSNFRGCSVMWTVIMRNVENVVLWGHDLLGKSSAHFLLVYPFSDERSSASTINSFSFSSPLNTVIFALHFGFICNGNVGVVETQERILLAA